MGYQRRHLAAVAVHLRLHRRRLEFQSRPFGSTVAYTTQRSSWFAIPTGETDLRRTGRVQVPVTGKIEWRVRVEDETGNLGPWPYGSSN